MGTLWLKLANIQISMLLKQTNLLNLVQFQYLTNFVLLLLSSCYPRIQNRFYHFLLPTTTEHGIIRMIFDQSWTLGGTVFKSCLYSFKVLKFSKQKLPPHQIHGLSLP